MGRCSQAEAFNNEVMRYLVQRGTDEGEKEG